MTALPLLSPEHLGVLRRNCIECRGLDVRLVIVGEAPGPTENKLGRPFVGISGEILHGLMTQASIDLTKVWIANAVACWPHEAGRGMRPVTREPPAASIPVCAGLHLDPQLDAFPMATVIVALGTVAGEATLGRSADGKFSRTKRLAPLLAYRPGEVGDPRVHEWRGRKVLVTWHPAYLARRGYNAGGYAWSHEEAAAVLRTLQAARDLAGAGVS